MLMFLRHPQKHRVSLRYKKKNKGNVNLQISIFLLPGKTADSPCEMSVLQGGEEIKSRRIRVAAF
ncbi:hypothetical protein NC653_011038 [Populus alba x Populus x berolinensis]|uniref:Uncharacterized protein n=1 Tax=Populus alba x Populus x berolinensis TaxID=444605 RepID=A0AAD6W6F5_9ROSI|nr:hypothetical protein NC653_011038 [Populus alba x Populus x berolinensis]